MEEKKETVYEIEKMAELKEAREATKADITFDNEGNMVYHNRAFERNTKRLWRAVMEGRPSIHYYTHKSRQDDRGRRGLRAARKLERQNRKNGRNK